MDQDLSFYEKTLLLHNDLHHIISFQSLLLGDQGEPIAQTYLKPGTLEHYNVTANQVTMYPYPGNHYTDILNSKGLALFASVKAEWEQRQLNSTFKDTISNWTLIRSNSGAWFADERSEHFNGIKGSLNSFNNICVTGVISGQRPISTSVCIFIHLPKDNQDVGWCLTQTGSFYRLQPSCSKKMPALR